VHAGSEEVTKLRFESRPGVEYELPENGIQTQNIPGLRCLRAKASFSGLKGSKALLFSGVGTFHRSDCTLLISLVDLQSPFLHDPFFTSTQTLPLLRPC